MQFLSEIFHSSYGSSEIILNVNGLFFWFGQANLSNANLEGALATGNTSFRGSTINGAGM